MDTKLRALLLSMTIATAFVALVAIGCDDEASDGSDEATATPAVTAQPTEPSTAGRASLAGRLTLDRAPLEAEFLGARVIRNGLSAACQTTIPAVVGGEYDIEVASDAEARGCGAPGAEILLWVFTNDTYYFTNETATWPETPLPFRFDATFSSSTPAGAGTPVTEMKGRLFDADGNELPTGTVIEAYVEDVLCGVASLRDGTEGVYTLIVAGPEGVAGCAQGATLTFRLDGEPAKETAVNDLGQGSMGQELDLTLQ